MNKINKNKIIIFSIIILGCFLFQPVLAEEATSTPSEPPLESSNEDLTGQAELVIIQGCTDSLADNYNSEATEDDNSCTYPEPEPEPLPVEAPLGSEEGVIIQGCTNPLSDNYNPEATEDDNSCSCARIEPEPVIIQPVIIQGCMDSSADNYNPEATTENGSNCFYSFEETTNNNFNENLLDELKELINSGLQTQQDQINQIQQQNQSNNEEPEEPVSEEPVFDPAIAPSKVTISVLMPNGTPPSFPVFVTFVGVGKKNFGGKIDANGKLTVTMPQGRYYTELMVVNTQYIQGEDGPSFFLEANEERDLGIIRLIHKSGQNSIGQSLSDKTLESNLDNELGAGNKGLASVLSMIVKLLMQILEELRALTSYIMSGSN